MLSQRTLREIGLDGPRLEAGLAIVRNNLLANGSHDAKFPKHDFGGAIMAKYAVEKPWGREFVLEMGERSACTLLVFWQGKGTSLHYHEERTESFYLLQGSVRVTKGENSYLIRNYGQHGNSNGRCGLVVDRGERHRLEASDDGPAIIVNAMAPFIMSDIVRVKDQFEDARKLIGETVHKLANGIRIFDCLAGF